jgi:hypothetical protein
MPLMILMEKAAALQRFEGQQYLRRARTTAIL